MITLLKVLEEQRHEINEEEYTVIFDTHSKGHKKAGLSWENSNTGLKEQGDVLSRKATEAQAGAVDGATRSSAHGRGLGHNDLLILSLPEADVSQQVVCPLLPSGN